MQQMAAAFTAALPGETLAEKVVSLAEKLGGVFDGVRWKFPSQEILRTIRRAATAWGVCPPEYPARSVSAKVALLRLVATRPGWVT